MLDMWNIVNHQNREWLNVEGCTTQQAMFGLDGEQMNANPSDRSHIDNLDLSIINIVTKYDNIPYYQSNRFPNVW